MDTIIDNIACIISSFIFVIELCTTDVSEVLNEYGEFSGL